MWAEQWPRIRRHIPFILRWKKIKLAWPASLRRRVACGNAEMCGRMDLRRDDPMGQENRNEACGGRSPDLEKKLITSHGVIF
jgi:hypothetical protein